MGGGWFDRFSSPAEALCLPHDPDFVTKDSATTDPKWVSSLYGAEYDSVTGPFIMMYIALFVVRLIVHPLL